MLEKQFNYESIQTIVHEEILAILEENESEITTLSDEDNLSTTLNLSSLDFAQLIAVLETRFQADPFAELVPVTSLRTIRDIIAAYTKYFFAGDTADTQPEALELPSPNLVKKSRELVTQQPPEQYPWVQRILRASLRKLGGFEVWETMLQDVRQASNSESDFHRLLLETLTIQPRFNEKGLETIPEHGPVVVVANHPFGLVDTAIINYLISSKRPDCKLLAYDWGFGRFTQEHSFFLTFPDKKFKDALTQQDIKSMDASLNHVKSGGTIIIFPAGIMASVSHPLGMPTDSVWKPFAAKIIMETQATVIPIYFHGQNSRFYHAVSCFSDFFFLSTTVREALAKRRQSIRLHVGDALPYTELAHITDQEMLSEHLRHITYRLSQE